MAISKIEWTEQTVNPIIGCSKCSPACQNCYALTMARRLAGMKGPVGDDYRRVVTVDGEWNGKTVFIPSVLEKIIKRKKPTTYFIGSMGDVFHWSGPDDWIDQVMEPIIGCSQHHFMILTKRPERMQKYMTNFPWGNPPKNLVLGVSVWDQASWDRNVSALLRTPVARLFVSAEPLLGPIDASGGDLSRLDLVIVGGETGPGARPIHPDWARSLRDQCSVAGVPFMFKQWGRWGWKYDDLMEAEYLVDYWTSKAAGRLLDGVEHNGAIQWAS